MSNSCDYHTIEKASAEEMRSTVKIAGGLGGVVNSYLVEEQGLIKDRWIPLATRLTIGRGRKTDLCLADPTISKKHAVVHLLEGKAVVEDLDSKNGTYVNAERVSKAVLLSGDTLRLGNMELRFIQELAEEDCERLAETQQFIRQDESRVMGDGKLAGPSHRVVEAVSNAPLFANLGRELLNELCHGARLLLFEQGRTIVRQGDRGRSLYIILDGLVRVFTYDHQGKEIFLSYLKENHFFGEFSLLTGSPRRATVQALEETLVCALSYKDIREVVRRSAALKTRLDEYFHGRLNDLEAKKSAAGMVERRRHPRFNVRLPVNLSVSSASLVSEYFKGKVFHCLSRDISVSGIRLEVEDRFLQAMPIGCQLRLEIPLPQPYGSIRCLGTLRNVMEAKGNQNYGCLGVEFTGISREDRAKVERFLFGTEYDEQSGA